MRFIDQCVSDSLPPTTEQIVLNTRSSAIRPKRGAFEHRGTLKHKISFSGGISFGGLPFVSALAEIQEAIEELAPEARPLD
jgi:hypothetical protein